MGGMRRQFIHLFSILLIFSFCVASENVVLQFAKPDAPRTYVRINQQDHSSVREHLMHPKLDLYNYVYVQTPDGQKRLMHKKQIPDYQPQFELGILNDYLAPSWIDRTFALEYQNRPQYFADKFAGNFPERIFHCVLNYQYPGFCKYVQQVSGFDDFILSMTEQLKAGSELQRRMFAYSGGKEAFAALQRLNKAKIQERNDREWQAKYQAIRQLLQSREFSQPGISILEQHDMTDQFTYSGNLVQMGQLKQITHFFNDVGAFQQEFGHVFELQQIVEHAAGFGLLSNQANRANNLSFSHFCLNIGQNILALGKGLRNGLERNVTGLCHLLRYPVDTGESIGYLVKTIGTGIGKVALTLSKHDLGLEFGDEDLICSAHQDVDNWVGGGRQLYEAVKQTWQSKSKLERYELTGNIASDFLLAKGVSWLGKLGSLKNLTSYQPQAFSKLGEIGREINQIAGLTCAKGVRVVEQGFEIIKVYPQIVQGQQLLGEAIWHGSKCLKASNQYLKKISKHAVKCALDSERRLVQFGEYVKKLPKACIAKTKQLIGEEVVVTDVLGNTWRSKIGKSDWGIEFSERGKKTLTLLNETAGGLNGAAHEAFQYYRTVPYGEAARKALNIMKWQFEAVERELQALGTTLKDFYGSHVTGILADQLIHFKGKSHLMAATIKRNIKASGIAERITGLHWDFGRKLEQLGVYSLSEVEHLVGGMYRATLNYGGVSKPAKTFFPSHWDAKMLLNKISEACYNATRIDYKWDGTLEIMGVVEEGFQITTRLDKRGKILTAFPDLIKKV